MRERIVPVEFVWTDDEVMKPQPRFMLLAQKQYVIGEHYMLAVSEERSDQSHRHYMACVEQAWLNLSPKLTAEIRTATNLRKRALIQSNYCDEEVIDLSDRKAVVRALKQPPKDSYVEIEMRGHTMIRRTARSQSYKSMKKDEFERSKADVLALLADMIGVKLEELTRAGKNVVG